MWHNDLELPGVLKMMHACSNNVLLDRGIDNHLNSMNGNKRKMNPKQNIRDTA
jgi:hypothetical protein